MEPFLFHHAPVNITVNPWKNPLLNHQLEQCMDSLSYWPITFCLHNHAMYIQGPGCQKRFPALPHCRYLSPLQRIQTAVYPLTPWPCHLTPAPLSTPKCHVDVTTRTAVCLPNKWKNLLDRDNNADKWNHGPTLPWKIRFCLLAVWPRLQS